MAERRKDSKNRVLKDGESERSNGGYQFRYSLANGDRKYVYARTLDELREKEAAIQRDIMDGIRTDGQQLTVNDVYEVWVQIKRGLKDNTFQNYKYMYDQFVRDDFGRIRIIRLRKSDVRRFYNYLAETRGLKISTIESIHTVLHQVLGLAVDDGYLRNNPSDSALKELKLIHNFETEKVRALTVAEQKLFVDFLFNSRMYGHWYPIFMLMLGTGLRVGEATGLRWEDINFEKGTISVNHTLVYYNHAENGCYFGVNTPKTRAGCRTVPMVDSVRQALMLEADYQRLTGTPNRVIIDGYRNFIFINRFGNVQHQGTLNRALDRIIRDCNKEVIENSGDKEDIVLLPNFSCHTLRHTFTTRLCESGVNVKFIQEVLGHSDISTTLDIYADVTDDFMKQEMNAFEDFWGDQNSAV